MTRNTERRLLSLGESVAAMMNARGEIESMGGTVTFPESNGSAIARQVPMGCLHVALVFEDGSIAQQSDDGSRWFGFAKARDADPEKGHGWIESMRQQVSA